MGAMENGFLSHRDRRVIEVFLSRIFKKPIRLKLARVCSEERSVGLIVFAENQANTIFLVFSVSSSVAVHRMVYRA